LSYNASGRARRVRVAILEDDHYQREMYVSVFAREGADVVGASGDPADFLSIIGAELPDVACIDLRLSGDEDAGVRVLRELKQLFPGVKCIVRTAYGYRVENLVKVLNAGAEAFLDKDSRSWLLGDLARFVADNGRYYEPSLVEQMADYLAALHGGENLDVTPANRENPSRELTPALRGVLSLAARGFSNADIARERTVSENTVRTQMQRIFEVLGARNREQAVILGRARGLIDDPPERGQT
jgi:DNA-binding NarL/FixJ family response regulator